MPALPLLHVASSYSEWSLRLSLKSASANRTPLSFSLAFAGSSSSLSNMSVTSVFPMCVRATRGFLKLRSGSTGPISPAALGFVRGASKDISLPETESATGGLAQAILQERLQQQSQVRRLAPLCTLDFLSSTRRFDGDRANIVRMKPPPSRHERVDEIGASSVTFPVCVSINLA